MKAKLRFWYRVAGAGVGAALLPGLLKVLLNAQISWQLLAILVLGKIGLEAASIRLGAHSLPAAIARALSVFHTVALSAVALTGILITPYSAYGIWFESVADGKPGGVVSLLLVLLAAIFATALSRRYLVGQILLPLYGQLLFTAGLLALIVQNRWAYGILLSLLITGSLVISLGHLRGRNRLRYAGVSLLLLLAVLAVCAAFMLFAEPGGSRLVDEQLHPGLRRAVVRLLPRFPLLYGIPGFGYGFGSDRLGGTPILSEAPIFEVRGRPGMRLYLRTSAFATYDGQSWSKRLADEAENGVSALGDSATGGLSTLPAGSIQPSTVLSAENPEDGTIRITLLVEYYTLVPFTLETRRIYLPPEQVEGVRGSLEQGLRLTEPLRAGQTVVLEQDRSRQAFSGKSPDLSPAERQAYLQLPDRLDPRVRALAGQLAAPSGEQRATLRNIERYLAANYTYNLEADGTPAGADFVDTFLFEALEGYCVHFASAFTVLARLNAIPCRYATGFLAPTESSGSPFPVGGEAGAGIVRGLSAHAWPEVWLTDRGWIAWEATTAVNPLYYQQLEQGWLYEYALEENRLTGRQLEAILGREALSRHESRERARRFDPRILLILVFLTLLLSIVIAAAARFAVLVPAVLRPDRRSARKLLAAIASRCARCGVEAPHTLGWARWARDLTDRSPPRQALHTARLLVVIQGLVYSNRPFRRLDLSYLKAFYLTHCLRPLLSRRTTKMLNRG